MKDDIELLFSAMLGPPANITAGGRKIGRVGFEKAIVGTGQSCLCICPYTSSILMLAKR